MEPERHELNMQRLRAALQEGLNELDRGEFIAADEVFRELRDRIDEPDKQNE